MIKLTDISWQAVAALAVLVAGAVCAAILVPEGEMRAALTGLIVALAGVLRVQK